MAFLNRCHINGVQFQDWHNKHHWPLGGTREHLDEVYKDIANREVYTEVVKKYISTQHSLGMKSMFYNLCFGALDDAVSDGVKEEWYIFKNTGRMDKDSHDLPSSWKVISSCSIPPIRNGRHILPRETMMFMPIWTLTVIR